MRILRWVLVLCLVAGGVWWWVRGDDVTRILARLGRLETLASHQLTDSMMRRSAGAAQMRELFSPEVSLVIRLPDRGDHQMDGRAELMESVARVKGGVDELRIRFLDSKVTLRPGKGEADMTATLHARMGVGAQVQEYYLEMKLLWVREKEGWVMTRLETLRTYGR